jgi:DNA modification methylase
MNTEILQGDCLEVLQGMDSESVDMCMTSPPYWGLRDYGEDGQLGLEPTYQEYIDKLIAIFDEVKRVLKETGTCWVNLGDTYSTISGTMGNDKYVQPKYVAANDVMNFKQPKTGLQSKCLIGIPERFAIAMTDAGWIRRNTIIWYKPSCMPSSANDRFTVDFEYLYFFTKKPQYWFEQQFEPFKSNQYDINKPRNKGAENYALNSQKGVNNPISEGERDWYKNGARNKRCVWEICPQRYSDAHFATYPEELCYVPIKAGCPRYICKKCGKAREKIYNKKVTFHSGYGKANNPPKGKWNGKEQQVSGDYDIRMGPKTELIDKGYTDCGCNAGFEGGTVLDPFMGSGTTLKVARGTGRNGIGIELNPEYIELAKKRIDIEQGRLF